MHAKIDGSLFEEKSLFWDSYIISLSLSLYIYIHQYGCRQSDSEASLNNDIWLLKFQLELQFS